MKTCVKNTIASAMTVALMAGQVMAQTNYTWTQTAGGAQSWTTGANWSGGLEPFPVSGDTVDFSTVNIANDTTLTLGADRTAEVWKFGDTDNNKNWIVATGNKIILAGTTPTIQVNTSGRTATLNCILDGTAGLKKDGEGTLSLDPNKTGVVNTFTGPIVLNGGSIFGASLNTLGSGGDITFTGSTWITPPHSVNTTFAKSVTVNPGVTATFYMISQFYNMSFTSPLAGSGTVLLYGPGGGAAGSLGFKSDSNTFTGTIQITSSGNGSVPLTVNSLPDSVNPIKFTGTSWPGDFVLGAGTATPLLFNSRQIELGSTTQGGNIRNNNATVGNTITINTDLLVSATGNKTLTLGGSNTGDNTFGGAITNGTSATISLTKADAGKWILTGVNTYSGATTISGGTLEIGGSGSLGFGTYAGTISNAGTLIFNSSVNQTLGGIISGTGVLIKDGAGTLSLTAANTYTGNTTNNAGTLSLGDGTNNSNLSDFSTLSVASSAVVNLNYTGTDKVFFLTIGGSPAAKGTWGATGSGATNIDDTHFTGTGVIDNLAGDTTSLNIGYWDGGSADILIDGNAASAGGPGTWNTTLKNWDFGFTAHNVWPSTPAFNAIFGGSVGTVTVGVPVNVNNLTFTTTSSGYIISGGTLAFESGATIDLSVAKTDHTITSAITGSPDVAVQFNDGKPGGVWSGPGWTEIYKGLTFAPSSGTVSLGTASVPKQGSTGDKAGLFLGGTTTGNTIEQILSPGGAYGSLGKYGAGTWTVKGNITIGTIQLEAGKLAIAGTVNTLYKHFKIMADGILAPGDGLGTVTFADSWTYIENGATIEWEFLSNTTPGTTYDQIVMSPSTLLIDMSTVTTSININVVGLEGYSVKEGDTFQLLAGTVSNFDANKFNIIGEGTWVISNSGGLLLTATFSSAPKGTLIQFF